MVHGLQKRYEVRQIYYPICFLGHAYCLSFIRLSYLRYNKTCGNWLGFSSTNVKKHENIDLKRVMVGLVHDQI
jgi:hypothetical protein